MATKAPTRKDGLSPASILRSKGSHVIAVNALLPKDEGENESRTELIGFVRNLGDTRSGWCEQADARRLTPQGAERLAKMHNESAERAKRKERFEARPFEGLFGDES